MTRATAHSHITIERIVLHGFSLSRADQERLRQTLAAELASRHDTDVHPEPTRAAWAPGDDPARLGQILGAAIPRRLDS